MSISQEINNLSTNLANAKSAISAKGGTVSDTGLAGISAEIASIPSGSSKKGMLKSGEGYLTAKNFENLDKLYLANPQYEGGVTHIYLDNIPSLTNIQGGNKWAIDENGKLDLKDILRVTQNSWGYVALRNVGGIKKLIPTIDGMTQGTYTLAVWEMPDLEVYDVSAYGATEPNIMTNVFMQWGFDTVKGSYSIPLLLGNCPKLTTFNFFTSKEHADDYFNNGGIWDVWDSFDDYSGHVATIQSYEDLAQIPELIRNGGYLLWNYYDPFNPMM